MLNLIVLLLIPLAVYGISSNRVADVAKPGGSRKPKTEPVRKQQNSANSTQHKSDTSQPVSGLSAEEFNDLFADGDFDINDLITADRRRNDHNK